MEEQLLKALDRFLNEDLEKLVLSNPREKEGTFKIQIRPVSIQGTLKFQAEEFAGKQAFHKNLKPIRQNAILQNSCPVSLNRWS